MDVSTRARTPRKHHAGMNIQLGWTTRRRQCVTLAAKNTRMYDTTDFCTMGGEQGAGGRGGKVTTRVCDACLKYWARHWGRHLSPTPGFCQTKDLFSRAHGLLPYHTDLFASQNTVFLGVSLFYQPFRLLRHSFLRLVALLPTQQLFLCTLLPRKDVAGAGETS